MYDIMYFLIPSEQQLVFDKKFSKEEAGLVREIDFYYIFEENNLNLDYHQISESDEICQ